MFERDELRQLDAFLPALRIATRFSQCILRQKAQEHSIFYQSRGDLVFNLDFLGRPVDEDREAILAQGGPLNLFRGRLVSGCSAEQQRLDEMISRALPGVRQHGAVSLTRSSDEKRFFLLAMPVCGEASEVFGPVSVLCVLIDPSREANPNITAVQNLSKAVGLTGRETEIAALVSIGLSPIDVARKLEIGEGTVRNHLKALMQKCSVHSQIELAALIERFG